LRPVSNAQPDGVARRTTLRAPLPTPQRQALWRPEPIWSEAGPGSRIKHMRRRVGLYLATLRLHYATSHARFTIRDVTDVQTFKGPSLGFHHSTTRNRDARWRSALRALRTARDAGRRCARARNRGEEQSRGNRALCSAQLALWASLR
jgi:hypothetical protein